MNYYALSLRAKILKLKYIIYYSLKYKFVFLKFYKNFYTNSYRLKKVKTSN
jgi:hypothetical protein